MVKLIASLTISVLFASALCPAQRKGASIDLIVSNGTVVTMDSGRRVIQHGAVVVDRGKIVAVGGPELITRYRARQTVDAKGGLIIPGLINGHTHVPMVLFRGLADDLDLNEWLTKYIFPAEARNVTEDFVRLGTQLGLAEMIRGGTTTYCDMYYFEDAVADETAKAGVRGVLGETILDFPAPDNKTNAEAMAYTERFIKHWTGHRLITAAIAPHAPYTVSAEHLIAARALSDRTGAPLVTHIAETRKELDDITRDKGQPPISYLEKIGFFNDRVIAAHVVYPAQGEISILKKHNVGVVHNPQSNMKLASGVAPVPAMLAADLSVGLGTDGAASNNDLDMFEEVDTAAKLHKLFSSDPKVLSAEQAFEMATIRGARALHMGKEIGSLEIGKRADIVIIDSDAINEVPSYNVYSQLVYSTKAADVRSVVVEGRVLMLNRRLLTLDETAIRMRAKAYRDKIRRSLEQKSAAVAPTGTTVMAGITSYSH